MKAIAIWIIIGLLSGCGSMPSGYDGDRNMKNMTAGEIERALAQ